MTRPNDAALEALAVSYSPDQITAAARLAHGVRIILEAAPAEEAILAGIIASATRFVDEAKGQASPTMWALLVELGARAARLDVTGPEQEPDDPARWKGRIVEITDAFDRGMTGTRWVIVDRIDDDTWAAQCVGGVEGKSPQIGDDWRPTRKSLEERVRRISVPPTEDACHAMAALAAELLEAAPFDVSVRSITGGLEVVVARDPAIVAAVEQGALDLDDLHSALNRLAHPWGKAVEVRLAPNLPPDVPTPDKAGTVGGWFRFTNEADELEIVHVLGARTHKGLEVLDVERWVDGRREESAVVRSWLEQTHEPITAEVAAVLLAEVGQ